MNTNLIKGSGVLNQTDYTSATVLSTAANFIMNRQEPLHIPSGLIFGYGKTARCS